VTTRQYKIDADHVILAVSINECLRLIQPHSLLNDIHRRLSTFRFEPICTVYLQYPSEVKLDSEMTGLLDGTGQWILDLGDAGHPGRMAVVISGPGPHMDLDNESLIAHIRGELLRHYPHWPEPLRAFVIREKRATFSCHAGINALRPAARTPVRGCWLAGDYTDTGLPATLEGALRSGVACARQIISG
jgi:predicted NAD/FAD-dependent oxidoreductase